MIQSIQCPCGREPETILHYHLYCDFYFIYGPNILNDICALNHSLKNLSKENLLKVPLYGSEEFSFKINSQILNCIITFLKKKKNALVAQYLFLVFFYFSSDQIFGI